MKKAAKRSSNKSTASKHSSRARIAQVVGYFPPHLGGMEVVAQEISLELARLGWPVEVITSNVDAKKLPRLQREGNLTVRRLRTLEFAHTPFMPALFWRLWRVKKPAIFHLHLSQAYLPELVWLVSGLRRIPYVVHYHLDVEPSGRLGPLFVLYKHYIQPIIIHGAAQVITLSPEQADMVKQRYHLSDDKVCYLPNGVSQAFLAIGKKPRTMHSPLRLLFVGRLAPQKRLDRLLEAMTHVSADVVLRIVGDGEERAKLEKMTQTLGLKNVIFVGALMGDARLHDYETADVFVLPSDREGMPLVLFEAMAAGLPVIGSGVQGIREHLTGYGIVVSDPSPTTFAEAIDDFYEHRDKQFPDLSKASREKAARYSWPKLTGQLERLYRGLGRPRSQWGLGRVGLLSGVLAWWLGLLELRTLPSVPNVVIDIVGFSFLVLAPGLLTVICLRLRSVVPWGKLVMSVAFSLLELMSVGVIGNTVLQWFGIRRPLDAPYLVGEISLLLVVLMIMTWSRTKEWQLLIGPNLRKLLPSGLDWLIALFPLVFVLLSVLGATSLNNGGTDLWTMGMLLGLAGFSLVIVNKSGKLSNTTVATALFLMSLSLLFMTSLRGWYTTGHDIQQEYRVFLLAKDNGVWQIQRYRDPYNACLSITILPTILANLTRLFDPYVYKVFFQILFATCPVVIYLFVRKWLSIGLAFLATLYFLSFPTFFTDMPYLNRQEIAFTFFALMLYVIFQDQIRLRLRRMLFLALGLGLVLSHYSTTYSVIVILFLAVGAWYAIIIAAYLLKRLRLVNYSSSSLGILHVPKELRRVTVFMLVTLTFSSFMWTVVLTDTGTSALTIARQTILTAAESFRSDTPKSNDTNYSLFSFSNVSPAKELSEYVSDTVKPARSNDPAEYYPIADLQKFPIHEANDTVQPLTSSGRYFTKHGLDVAAFNYDFRQASAKLLQILVISGFIFVLFRRTYNRLLDSDFMALAVGSVIFVGLQVVLPILSVQYGLLRAFQQSLMLLGLFTVLGSIAIFAWLPSRKLRIAATSLLAVLFLLSSTGVLTQAIGGYYAQLNLSNSGTYYDNYYTQPQEIAAIGWLNNLAKQSSNSLQLQMDDSTYSRLNTYTKLVPSGDIYPSLISRQSYVFLGYANVKEQQSTVVYNGDLITYAYPVQFLDQQKNLIYSNGGAEIYR
jgi:uncharacterized membrane protein/glycosyltransferase involved in cell wall biosynthesis